MDKLMTETGTDSGMAMGNTHMEQREERQKHREGPLALSIEHQTAKLPSDVFLWAAFGAIAASAAYQLRGNKGTANFIGHWAPTFLVLGLYNKIVKVLGSDRAGGEARANASDPVERVAESLH